MRRLGTVVRGIRTPVIKTGDDLEKIVIDSILKASKENSFDIKDRDVIGITEAVVGITQKNYVTVKQVSKEIGKIFPDSVGIIYPILSRNRFSLILEAAAKGSKEVHVLLSYPADEFGNHLIEEDLVELKGVDPDRDSFEEDEFRKIFGKKLSHRFTGIDYPEFYRSLGNGNIKIHFSNDPTAILKYTKNILVSDVHSRVKTKKTFKKAGADLVLGLDDLFNKKSDKHGYNLDYGLLGSNKVADDKLKLFPRDCDIFVNSIQTKIKEITGKDVEVLVYGDGAFKDPVGGIWELADPVVSPGYTKGLEGTPKEIKLKYISENCEKGEDIQEYVKKMIKDKKTESYEENNSLGTTPRQLTDLLGSLCDLTSGSGDKGTPVIYIQGYFDDYTVE
jgi:F420-0:gamma-glutamyl ligase